jgi:polyhydroxyalkanoate synthesis regulator phasin
LQKQLQDNLDKQYASKTDTNSWKDFQNSDMYISIFENLDHTSNRVLTAMKARLEGLRSSLKNLTPEQLKQIVEQINKIDALLVERNPYSNIGKNFKEYLKFAKQRKKLEEEYIDATQKEQILKNDQSNANKDVKNAEIAYNNAVRKYGVASKEAIQARILLDIDKERLRTITDQLVAQGKITEKQAKQIRNGQKLQKTLQQQIQTIGQNFSDAASSVTELFSALNDWGANIEMSDDLSEVVDGISKIGSSLEGIDITRPFSVVKGTIGVIGGIGKTLGGIFGWGTKDKKLQKQIENHQKATEKLRERYSELKDAMDNAFDIESLAQYNDEMVKNLKDRNIHIAILKIFPRISICL